VVYDKVKKEDGGSEKSGKKIEQAKNKPCKTLKKA